MECKTLFQTYRNVYLFTERYIADNSLFIEIISEEDEPIAVITVCLVDESLESNESYIDTNNCPWALDFIQEYQLGEITGRTRQSGYCTYPSVKFNIDKLKQYSTF